MTDFTPTLGLPYLLPSQAQKHVTVNESLGRLDVLVQLAVKSAALTDPPAAPAEGDSYVVAAAATGAWAGHEGEIATWQDGAWALAAPAAGWRAWNEADGALILFDGTAWRPALNPVPMAGINAAADAANRLAVKSPASLFDHDGGGHQLKVNRATAGDTASLLFQTGHSGRAELGLAGDAMFRIKLSPDGSSWTGLLTADPATSRLGILTDTPAYTLDVNGLVGSRGASPGFYLHETDQAEDERIWRMTGGGGNFFVQAVNDAGTAAQQALAITRNGAAVDSIRLLTEGSIAIYAGPGQNVAIGHQAPTTRLHVDGPVRVGQYAAAGLPDAAAAGAGAIAFVTDASGGAQLAYSDGTNWRKVRDGTAV